MKRTHKLLCALLCLGLLSSAWASGMSVEFDKERIEAGNEFRMDLVIPQRQLPAQRGIPRIGDLRGFSLRGMDSTDEVTRDFFGRGFAVRKYRYTLLAPKSAGQYSLPLLWEIDGTEKSVGSVSVDVKRPYDAPALRVTLQPSKRTLYEGEQFSLGMNLETYETFQGGLNLAGIDLGNDFVAHRSDLAGLQMQRSSRPGVGLEASAKIAWLSPIRTGQLRIPELRFQYKKAGAPKVVQKQMGNFSFSSVSQESEDAVATSGTISLQVLPLPSAGRPEPFSGLVGQYTFSVEYDKSQLQVGEALTMIVRMRGNGKPGAIPDPQMPDFSDFRSVPPESKIVKTEQGGQIWTERTLKIFLYPKKKGEFTVAPLRFTWFDPIAKRYKEQLSEPKTIVVEKGELTELAATGGLSMQAAVSTVSQKDIERLGSDIRYARLRGLYENQQQNLHRQPLFYFALLLPWLLCLGALRYTHYRRLQKNDPAFQRRSQAHAKLHQAWKLVDRAQANSDFRQVLALSENALLDFLGDHHNLDLRGLTRPQLQEQLRQGQVSDPQLQALLSWLERCDQLRFSPLGANGSESHLLFTEAQALAERWGTR